MQTAAVTVEFIIGVDAVEIDDIIAEVEEAVCRIDSFNTDILSIHMLESGRTIEPDWGIDSGETFR